MAIHITMNQHRKKPKYGPHEHDTRISNLLHIPISPFHIHVKSSEFTACSPVHVVRISYGNITIFENDRDQYPYSSDDNR